MTYSDCRLAVSVVAAVSLSGVLGKRVPLFNRACVRRVLRPPGGGSNFSLGFDEPTEQPVRRNKMASSIFGTPEENPPSWAKSAENVDTDLQASLGQSEEKPVPAAPVPSPVAPAPVPSRRNPPGGKSSLVLG
ncbi:hematological and neurological expressed 1 protein [Camelus ferus]|nr:hematological and neurological expressed 1 protein [Camelus ferus]